MRVLIADDNDMVRERLAERIAAIAGVTESVHAADGEEALAALDNGQFGVIVLDIHMPKVNGFAVLKELQARQSAPIVIVLTENLAYHHYALRLGASHCFDKASETELAYSTIEELSTGQPRSSVS